jgi:hypothetical protein
MNQIPVVDRRSKAIVWISPSEVLYIKYDKTGTLVYTRNKEYRGFHVLEDWQLLLQPFGFVRVDRGNIVNLHQIEHLSERAVFFSPPYDVRINSLFATASEEGLKKLKREMRDKR